MSRRTTRLTVDVLDDLGGHAAECVFWQLDPVRRSRVIGHEADEVRAWTSTVLREWGSCGRVLRVGDRWAGHALWAPPVFVPGAGGFATAPPSSDAVLLLTAYVEPEFRGGGLGRVLVQAMARDLIKRGDIKAVEAFGAIGPRPGCVLPRDFLRAVGFATQREHPRHPRMRMDLRSTVTWRDELEAALERLVPGRRLVPTVDPSGRAAH